MYQRCPEYVGVPRHGSDGGGRSGIDEHNDIVGVLLHSDYRPIIPVEKINGKALFSHST